MIWGRGEGCDESDASKRGCRGEYRIDIENELRAERSHHRVTPGFWCPDPDLMWLNDLNGAEGVRRPTVAARRVDVVQASCTCEGIRDSRGPELAKRGDT